MTNSSTVQKQLTYADITKCLMNLHIPYKLKALYELIYDKQTQLIAQSIQSNVPSDNIGVLSHFTTILSHLNLRLRQKIELVEFEQSVELCDNHLLKREELVLRHLEQRSEQWSLVERGIARREMAERKTLSTGAA